MTTIILPDDLQTRFPCPDDMAIIELATVLAEEYGLRLTNDLEGNIVTEPMEEER